MIKSWISLKKLISYVLILMLLFTIVFLVIVGLTNRSKANEWFGARKYPFTEDQIKRIASMCYHENGTSVDAMRAEASVMANLYEKNRNEPYTTSGLINYLTTSGWFATSDKYYNPTTVSTEYLNAVKDVLINGNRYFPVYVDEHDWMGDIVSVSNNGVTFNKYDRGNYIPGVTIIKNCYGSTYTFYCFPDNQSDPFGYISKNTNSGTITSITIETLPQKLNYYVEDEVDITGIKLFVEYDNGTWKTISDEFEYSPKVLNETGKQKITISYENEVAEFEVNVKKAEPIVNIQYDNKVIYEDGQLPYITLSEGDTEGNVSWDSYTLEIGTNTYKWTFIPNNTNKFNNKTGEVQFTVIAKKIERIIVEKAPEKTSYIRGEDFDATGMKVIGIYNDGSRKEITQYNVIDGNDLKVEKNFITIQYEENGIITTTNQEITVIERLSIEIEGFKEIEIEGKKYITSINPLTTIKELLNNIKNNGDIEIYNDSNIIINQDIKICTGTQIRFKLNNEQKNYTLIVLGDIDGDGDATFADILQINKHRLNKINFDIESLIAGDVTNDGRVDFDDILKINKYRLNKIDKITY